MTVPILRHVQLACFIVRTQGPMVVTAVCVPIFQMNNLRHRDLFVEIHSVWVDREFHIIESCSFFCVPVVVLTNNDTIKMESEGIQTLGWFQQSVHNMIELSFKVLQRRVTI